MIWIMRKKVRRGLGLIAILVFGSALAIIAGGLVALSSFAGYTRGALSSYSQGKQDGYTAACTQLLDQARWAINTEKALVASGHDSPEVGAKIQAEIAASYHYACSRTVASGPNLYDPSTTAPPTVLGRPSLPVSRYPSGNPSILTAGKPKPKPTPKRSPPNDD